MVTRRSDCLLVRKATESSLLRRADRDRDRAATVAVIGTGPGSDWNRDRGRRPGGRGGGREGETPARPVLVEPVAADRDLDRAALAEPVAADRDLDRAALAEPVADDRRLDVLADLDLDRDLDLDPARSGRIATLDLDPARCRAGQRNYHDLRRGAGRVENLTGGTNDAECVQDYGNRDPSP